MMPPSRPARSAMTLVEMLVAMAATLVLMAAVAQVFGAFGAAISGSRAALGVDARLRTAASRLRDDLAGVTVQMLPPRDAGQGEGYFELIEGPLSDGAAAAGTDVSAADIDDVLLFTTRSNGAPFIGRGPGGAQFESSVAEVAWFARPTVPATTPATYTLYRRQLLVMGYVGAAPFTAASNNTLAWSANGSSWAGYYNSPCDISARLEGSSLSPNTLGDLTRRENRFMHGNGIANGAVFPYGFVAHQSASTLSTGDVLPTALVGLIFDENSARRGEDIVLTNVLSFDVRVFDPAVPVSVTSTGSTALVPGDPGFTTPATPAMSGAYVDLGHGVSTNSLFTGATPSVTSPFSGFGAGKSQLVGSATTRRTYCTWSTHYEANGRDDSQPANSLVDEGTDGLDNDGDSLVDEGSEQETSPPYPYPLRGVEVRIRCYEQLTRQVRQVTVRHTFVPH